MYLCGILTIQRWTRLLEHSVFSIYLPSTPPHFVRAELGGAGGRRKYKEFVISMYFCTLHLTQGISGVAPATEPLLNGALALNLLSACISAPYI